MGFFPKPLDHESLRIPYALRIFNVSLQTSQIPDDWRHAIVTPVAKAPAQQTQTYSGPSA